MTDFPGIFNAAMILALLGDRKTMTRRLAWREPNYGNPRDLMQVNMANRIATIWQKVRPGDRLWVKETHAFDGPVVRYYATDDVHELRRKRRSIHMPRWASRLTLVVTAVKIERLQDISRNDVGLEGLRLGLTGKGMPSPCDFRDLWNSLHGPDAWAENQEVVAISFALHRQNIDQMGAA